MLWTAYCTGFFGFLYSGEFTCPTSAATFGPCYQFQMLRWPSPQSRRPKCLLITLNVLWRLFRVQSCPPVSYDRIMLYEACGTWFYGFLHSGELTCPPSAATFSHVLSESDAAVDSHSNPSFASVRSHHSKTDIFGVGTTVFFGWLDGMACPLKALLAYLALRSRAPRSMLVC